MIGTGAMSDPYMPLEMELNLTRQCAELIERYGFGLTVLTKSDNVLRDLDLFRRINAKTKCVIQMTLTDFILQIQNRRAYPEELYFPACPPDL